MIIFTVLIKAGCQSSPYSEFSYENIFFNPFTRCSEIEYFKGNKDIFSVDFYANDNKSMTKTDFSPLLLF